MQTWTCKCVWVCAMCVCGCVSVENKHDLCMLNAKNCKCKYFAAFKLSCYSIYNAHKITETKLQVVLLDEWVFCANIRWNIYFWNNNPLEESWVVPFIIYNQFKAERTSDTLFSLRYTDNTNTYRNLSPHPTCRSKMWE